LFLPLFAHLLSDSVWSTVALSIVIQRHLAL
jgi:hypothetical protein